MPTGVLSPSPVFTGWDQNGDPLPGGLLETFLAGTSTPAATYQDVNLTVPNTNPVVLDAAGRCVLFLTPAQGYKFVLKNAAGAIQWSVDNISAGTPGSPTIDISGVAGEALGAGKVVYLSDGSGGKVAGRWYLTQTANGYSSTLPVIGMTIASIGGGGTGVIRTEGVVTGLSGLVVGQMYTAGDAGTLATGGARNAGQADTISSVVLDTRNTQSSSLNVTTTGTIATLPIPIGYGNLVVIMNNATAATVHGITPGLPGQQLTIYHIGLGLVQFPYASASAGAPNQRLFNFATSAPTSIMLGAVTYVYEHPNFWRMVAHEQGSWITVPFSAANYFSGGGGGTWTVQAGDVGQMAYSLNGRTITLAYTVNTSTVTGAVSNLGIGSGVWGSFVPKSQTDGVGNFYDGVGGVGFVRFGVDSILRIFHGFLFTAANWTVTVDATTISGVVSVEVT